MHAVHPITTIDFRDLSAEKINSYTDQYLKATKKAYDTIAECAEPPTFANTFQVLEDLETEVYIWSCLVNNMHQFHPDEAVRNASREGTEKIGELEVECSMRKDVYDRFKLLSEGEGTTYTGEKRRLMDHCMRSYRRSGVHLDNPRIKEIKSRMNTLKVSFDKNLGEEDTTFEMSKEQLDGLEESWFTEEKKLPSGKYKVTLKYPDVVPIFDFCKVRETRKTIYMAFNTRCAKENTPLFQEMIKLRSELATLLGYDTFADYATEVNMIKNGTNAMNFVKGLSKDFTPILTQELQDLQKLSDTKMEPWDIRYLSRMFKEKTCSIDTKEVKKYFPLNTVRKGMFEIFQHILQLKFVKHETDNVWHEEVELFDVYDATTSEMIGCFTLDLHPRKGKYGHAAIFPFITGRQIKDGRTLPLATMACNFPKDSTLSYGDVETFFHEFGHVMHHICSKAQYSDHSGFHVEGDFVEAPSQMLEFWCLVPKPIQMMSRHEETGEVIPLELIEKLKQSKKLLQGYHNKRQLLFGIFDQTVHSMKDIPDDWNADKLWEDVEREVFQWEPIPGLSKAASFGHLMHGYEAGYYGYLKAESAAADMFYTKFEGKELDETVGLHYRKVVLQQGSTKDAEVLLEEFLGRPTNDKAFVKDKGLA